MRWMLRNRYPWFEGSPKLKRGKRAWNTNSMKLVWRRASWLFWNRSIKIRRSVSDINMLYPLEASTNWNLFLSPRKAGRFVSRQKGVPKIIQYHASLVVAPTSPLSSQIGSAFIKATQQHAAIVHECLLSPPGAASPSAAWPTLCALATADAQLLGFMDEHSLKFEDPPLFASFCTLVLKDALWVVPVGSGWKVRKLPNTPNERPGVKDACSDPGTETRTASWSLTKVSGCTVKGPILLHWESKPTKQSCRGLLLSQQKLQVVTGCPTKLGLQTPFVKLGGSRYLTDSSCTIHH